MAWHGNTDRVSHQLSPPSSRLKRRTRQHGRVARSTTGKPPPGRNSHVIKPTPTNIPQLQYEGAQGAHVKLEHQARVSGGTSSEKAQYSVVTLITFATRRQLRDSLLSASFPLQFALSFYPYFALFPSSSRMRIPCACPSVVVQSASSISFLAR